MSSLRSVRELATSGQMEEARQALARLAADAPTVGRVDLARCALELAMSSLALKELNLARRDDPDDVEVLGMLADLYEDRGEHEQELRVRQHLAQTTSDARNEARLEEITSIERTSSSGTETTEVEDATHGLAASEPDLLRFLHMSSGREGVHARMWFDQRRGTGYSPVEQPLTVALLRAHLGGSVTLGVYPVRLDHTVNFFAFDIDVTKKAIERARGDREETRRVRRLLREAATDMRDALRGFGLDPLHVDSGYKGRHLWVFLAEPLPAQLVRRLANALARAVWTKRKELSLEIFPKQSEVSRDKLGNLIKLPLGIHLRSKRRAWVLGEDGRPAADPWQLLSEAELLGRAGALDLLAGLRDQDVDTPFADHDEDDEEGRLPAPPPMPDRPVFTEADFEAHPEVSALKRRCPVLSLLVEKGLEQRRLSHDEQIVLRHTWGHVPQALPAVNYVLERCPEISPAAHLQSPLRGNPMSCPKIRKRIPEVTSTVACHCVFTVNPDHYPTPILHLEEARARGELSDRPDGAPREALVAEEIARTFVHLQEKLERIDSELQEVRGRFVEALERLPGRRLETEDGAWSLAEEEGLAVLDWQAHPRREEEE